MKVYNREELKNCRFFFDKQPPKYLFFLNGFLILFLISSIAGSNFVTKNYIAEAEDKSYVTATTNGTVIKVYKQDGEFVTKGDVLVSLSTGTEGVQENEIQDQLAELELKQDIFYKYENSLNSQVNYMKNEGNRRFKVYK